MPAQPNPNPKNREAQQVYSGETSYPTYVVAIQEINLRSGRILPVNQPPSPHRDVEEEREESNLKIDPPFPERLAQPLQPTPEEIELLEELKNLCVKIPFLQVICPKYLDPGSPVVDVHINGNIVPHTLIDLGVAINVMTKDTMLKLNLQGSLRKTTTILQLVDHSTVTPKGIVEDVMVSIDSWEYPAYFSSSPA
eukprot:PITA_06669